MTPKLNKLAFAAGAVLFSLVIYMLGPGKVLDALRGARYSYVAATLAAYAAGSALRIYKWTKMRDRMGAGISLGGITAIYFSSKLWGMFSPMRSGEAVPAFLSGDQRGRVLSIILYDRVIETFQTLIVFAGLFLWLYGGLFGGREGLAIAGLFTVLAAAVFLMFRRGAGEFAFSAAYRLISPLERFGFGRSLHGLFDRLKVDMEVFYAATRAYFSAGFAFELLALTFLAWFFELMFWVLIFWAVGADAPVWLMVTSVVVFSMVGALAPIPGGVGVSEAGLAAVLGYFGYAAEAGGIVVLVRGLNIIYIFAAYLLFCRPTAGGGAGASRSSG